MSDLFGVGTGIAGTMGAAASIYGSNVSKHESKANRKEARRQFNEQMAYAKNQTQIRVDDALKAGINPLAALGQSANVSPTFHAGGASGAGELIANAGQHMSKALQAIIEDKAADDAAYDSESKKLDLESKRIENQILQKRLDGMTTPGFDTVPDEQPKMIGQKTLFTPVYDIQGRPRLVLDQNVMETDADNPGYTSSMIATMAEAAKRGDIDLTTGKIKNSQLRMLIDDFYYNTTGHHITNLEDLYISPSEAAAIAAYVARGLS